MNDAEQRAAAKQFAQDWQARGDEKQDNQSFWLALLQKVFGVAEPEKYINFEYPVLVDDGRKEKGTTKFIDGYIATTRVLIEQKGRGIDLTIGYRQSDESFLTPYQQARRYGGYLPQSEQPRWIIVSNFDEFDIHDMNRPNDSPEIVKLCDLEKEYHRLQFLVDTTSEHIKKEMEISLKAGELVGVLYDALLAQYQNPNDPETLKSLNALCVRLVFCLYAEDAGIFGKHLMFHDYLKSHERDARRALIDLFRVLDQKPENRDPYMDEDLAAFPYVNGGLFSDENIIIPRLTEKIVSLILREASENFDWSDISPTIFGAVFESTLNPETRRQIRTQMGLTDKFVVGVVGRLTYQKNPQFTVEIFAKVKEKRPNAVLMFVGQGELEEEIRRLVQAKGLTDSVLFLGLRTDVPDLMQAMDAFVLPSRFEGLGIVYIEAQAAGLKTFATAEVVPQEACVDESLFTYLPREATAQQWADAMLAADTTQRENKLEVIQSHGYDIHQEAEKLRALYLKGKAEGEK